MYQWTDAQGTNIQNFCKYLQENMNVEFEYESTFYDDGAQVSCGESDQLRLSGNYQRI